MKKRNGNKKDFLAKNKQSAYRMKSKASGSQYVSQASNYKIGQNSQQDQQSATSNAGNVGKALEEGKENSDIKELQQQLQSPNPWDSTRSPSNYQIASPLHIKIKKENINF